MQVSSGLAAAACRGGWGLYLSPGGYASRGSLGTRLGTDRVIRNDGAFKLAESATSGPRAQTPAPPKSHCRFRCGGPMDFGHARPVGGSSPVFRGGPHEGGAGPAAAVLCFLPHDAVAEAGAHATAPSLPSHRKKRLGRPVTTGAAFEPKRLAPNTRLPGASGRGRLCLLRGLVPTCVGAASQALPRRRCLGAWSPGCGGHPASFRARVPQWGRPPGHSRVLERGPHARPAGDADGTWPSPPTLIGDGCRQGLPLARRATHKLPTPPA